ncbi:MAG: hypothetical protein PHX43_03930 [Alphaproteobacteria bacterium]|nr:hypothetical protein [Alphaproteobacteria bacterium]
MTDRPIWLANIPAQQGVDDLYSRFCSGASVHRRGFASTAVERFFADSGIAQVYQLYDYGSPSLAAMYENTQQGKYRVVFSKENWAGKIYPDGVVVNVKMAADENVLRLGDEVFAAINKQKLPNLEMSRLVKSISSNFVVDLKDHGDGVEYKAYVSPYINGQHPYSNKADLFTVGAGLGSLANAFAELDDTLKEKIHLSSRDAIARSKEGAGIVLQSHYGKNASCALGAGWLKANGFSDVAYKELVRHAEKYLSDTGENSNWGPNHFDMILGNVLVNGKSLVVLDNERVPEGWAPRGTDIGLAATRIALAAESKSWIGKCEGKRAKVSNLLDGYNSTAEAPIRRERFGEFAQAAACVGKLFPIAWQIKNGVAGAGEKFIVHAKNSFIPALSL